MRYLNREREKTLSGMENLYQDEGKTRAQWLHMLILASWLKSLLRCQLSLIHQDIPQSNSFVLKPIES